LACKQTEHPRCTLAKEETPQSPNNHPEEPSHMLDPTLPHNTLALLVAAAAAAAVCENNTAHH
jgi:hypothetical protein